MKERGNMEYSAYDAIIYDEIKTTCIFLIVLLCFSLFVIPLFVIPFSKSKDKEDKKSAKFIAGYYGNINRYSGKNGCFWDRL